MTVRWYACDHGADVASDVTESNVSTGLHINVAISYDVTPVASKLSTLKALEAIKQAIHEDTWPPV